MKNYIVLAMIFVIAPAAVYGATFDGKIIERLIESIKSRNSHNQVSSLVGGVYVGEEKTSPENTEFKKCIIDNGALKSEIALLQTKVRDLSGLNTEKDNKKKSILREIAEVDLELTKIEYGYYGYVNQRDEVGTAEREKWIRSLNIRKAQLQVDLAGM